MLDSPQVKELEILGRSCVVLFFVLSLYASRSDNEAWIAEAQQELKRVQRIWRRISMKLEWNNVRDDSLFLCEINQDDCVM